jgi:ATP synthase protein I
VTAPAAGPVAPWDLSHVRVGLLTTAALAAVGIPATWLLRGGRGAFWVAVGLAVVAVFFSAGAYAVAAAGRVDDRLTLPAALGSYLVKVVLLGVLLVAVRGRPDTDGPALGLAVLAGTVAWTGMHVRRVWTAKLYYVDPPAR